MSLDEKIWCKQLEEYPKADECIGKSATKTNTLPSYQYLYKLKNEIPKELYAYQFRRLLAYNTANVPMDFRLKMFQDVDRDDIMYQEELDAICQWGERVIIYRGASKNEEKPGLSWSLKRDIAESSDFHQGRLFIAEIHTSNILLYLSKDTDEEEVIAHVIDNYEIIDD